MPEEMLKGKVAIVTGAGSGIGRVIAETFFRQGAAIGVVDLNQDAALETVDIIRKAGGTAFAVQADVSVPEAVDEFFVSIQGRLGKMNILVNNAGVTHPAESILDLDLTHVDRVFAVDYKGVYLCSRRAGKEMIRNGSGCIINISSIAGLTPLPLVMYGPMKSAVNMLTRILAREWAQCGIRVNAIAPGYVLTPLIAAAIKQGQRNAEKIINRIPIKRMLDPQDIADSALFLSSEKARHITGAILPVDGGWIADGGWSAYDR